MLFIFHSVIYTYLDTTCDSYYDTCFSVCPVLGRGAPRIHMTYVVYRQFTNEFIYILIFILFTQPSLCVKDQFLQSFLQVLFRYYHLLGYTLSPPLSDLVYVYSLKVVRFIVSRSSPSLTSIPYKIVRFLQSDEPLIPIYHNLYVSSFFNHTRSGPAVDFLLTESN